MFWKRKSKSKNTDCFGKAELEARVAICLATLEYLRIAESLASSAELLSRLLLENGDGKDTGDLTSLLASLTQRLEKQSDKLKNLLVSSLTKK